MRSASKRGHRNSFINHAMLLIHQKDSLGSVLTCQDPKEFNWQSQMRHYLEPGQLIIECISVRFPYCYEYMGTSERLVITNLTERAQRGLLLAMHLRYAGSP